MQKFNLVFRAGHANNLKNHKLQIHESPTEWSVFLDIFLNSPPWCGSNFEIMRRTRWHQKQNTEACWDVTFVQICLNKVTSFKIMKLLYVNIFDDTLQWHKAFTFYMIFIFKWKSTIFCEYCEYKKYTHHQGKILYLVLRVKQNQGFNSKDVIPSSRTMQCIPM